MTKQEALRHWEMVYDPQRDVIVMKYIPIESMKDGYAKIAGEFVPAKKLVLDPEQAKREFIEKVEEGCRQLETKRDNAIKALKANRDLLETAKGFPVLQAAQAVLDEEEAAKAPAIYLPGKGVH